MDPLREEAIHHPRHVKIICVGAGPSGLCLAYKLKRSFRSYTLTIYEKNPKVGGTWYENRYPGCACDVPSHNYVYSFEPKADFTSVYSGAAEIQQYFEDFTYKYGLEEHLRLSHTVKGATWDEEKGIWKVKAARPSTTTVGEVDAVEDWCHILVHASGYLNKPAWPKVPGLDEFEGIKVHSADYDADLDLTGRRVLVVGAGSSAVQIVPAIQPIAAHVTMFVRSPSWVLPDISTEAGKVPPEQIEEYVRDPDALLRLRQDNERTMNSIFSVYLKDSVLQKQARSLLETVMERMIGDKVLADKLIPNFDVGCKRVIPSGYRFLRTLKQDNVSVVCSAVQSFTRTGAISASGTSHTADVIICATGFDTSYIPRYPVIGPSELNLQTEWADAAVRGAYMGVGISGFPNTFTLLGPYTPVSNGPTLVAIEAQTDYICAFIDRYQTEPSLHSFTPQRDACDDFAAHVAAVMARTVWTAGCRNSHNNHVAGAGSRVPTTWPGSTLHYLEAIREPRWDDWRFQHRGNRFSWLGISGLSQTEWDPTADLAYYVAREDNGPWNTRARRLAVVNRSGSMPPRELHRQVKLAAQCEAGRGE